jgi:hypothetical protein
MRFRMIPSPEKRGDGNKHLNRQAEPMEAFWKLAAVCLKMLFRKSTRKRFVCLVLAFLFMMGLNTFFFLDRTHDVEMEKKRLLNEKAFKAFFVRARTRPDCHRLLHRYGARVEKAGGRVVDLAFIYQNNLFVHFGPLPEGRGRQASLGLIRELFGLNGFAETVLPEPPPDPYLGRVRNAYQDHNGAGLSPEIVVERHDAIQRDLYDMADMIRAPLRGRRLAIYNDLTRKVVENLRRTRGPLAPPPNPYFSRVEAVVPLNLLYILSHLQDDTTTDIMDLAESVHVRDDGMVETFREYLGMPESDAPVPLYAQIDAYPRYIPIHVPSLLSQGWHWMMYRTIDLNTAMMALVDEMHFKGNLLFSYEKTRIIQDRVQRINADMRANQVNFYFTDLAMGIAFPFMISLFAFIHLKTELAFLLMFKNRIRQLLMIFWLLPLMLMLAAKGGLLAGYMVAALAGGTGMDPVILWPLLISFAISAAVFYPINRWCFVSYTSDNLSLHELHKGR